MLVDIIELYRQGTRLPREEWSRQPRVRGDLRVLPYFSWRGHDRPAAYASLDPYGLLEELDKVRIAYWWGRNIVLFGDQRARGRIHPQMWWCKIIENGSAAQSITPSASRMPPAATEDHEPVLDPHAASAQIAV